MLRIFRKTLFSLMMFITGALLIATRDTSGNISPLRVLIAMIYCLILFVSVVNLITQEKGEPDIKTEP